MLRGGVATPCNRPAYYASSHLASERTGHTLKPIRNGYIDAIARRNTSEYTHAEHPVYSLHEL